MATPRTAGSTATWVGGSDGAPLLPGPPAPGAAAAWPPPCPAWAGLPSALRLQPVWRSARNAKRTPAAATRAGVPGERRKPVQSIGRSSRGDEIGGEPEVDRFGYGDRRSKVPRPEAGWRRGDSGPDGLGRGPACIRGAPASQNPFV